MRPCSKSHTLILTRYGTMLFVMPGHNNEWNVETLQNYLDFHVAKSVCIIWMSEAECDATKVYFTASVWMRITKLWGGGARQKDRGSPARAGCHSVLTYNMLNNKHPSVCECNWLRIDIQMGGAVFVLVNRSHGGWLNDGSPLIIRQTKGKTTDYGACFWRGLWDICCCCPHPSGKTTLNTK